jgi:hypothetical protein
MHDSLVHYRSNTWIDVQFLVIKKFTRIYLRLHKNPPQFFLLDLELLFENVLSHVKEVSISKKKMFSRLFKMPIVIF